MTFDQWLNEKKGSAGPRMWRLMDDINSPDPGYNDMMLNWLETAWHVGYDHAVYLIQDDGK